MKEPTNEDCIFRYLDELRARHEAATEGSALVGGNELENVVWIAPRRKPRNMTGWVSLPRGMFATKEDAVFYCYAHNHFLRLECMLRKATETLQHAQSHGISHETAYLVLDELGRIAKGEE